MTYYFVLPMPKSIMRAKSQDSLCGFQRIENLGVYDVLTSFIILKPPKLSGFCYNQNYSNKTSVIGKILTGAVIVGLTFCR